MRYMYLYDCVLKVSDENMDFEFRGPNGKHGEVSGILCNTRPIQNEYIRRSNTYAKPYLRNITSCYEFDAT